MTCIHVSFIDLSHVTDDMYLIILYSMTCNYGLTVKVITVQKRRTHKAVLKEDTESLWSYIIVLSVGPLPA